MYALSIKAVLIAALIFVGPVFHSIFCVFGQTCGEMSLISSSSKEILSSPSFGSYGPNLNCFWIISASPGLAVELTITSFMLQDSNSCVADSLTIYDGASTSAEVLFGPECGSDIQWPVFPTTIVSTGNAISILLTTDGSVSEAGFQMTYQEVSRREEFFLVAYLGGIYKLNKLGQNYETVVSESVYAIGVGFDPVERKVYFADTGTNTINRVNIDGSDHEIIASADIMDPLDLAVDDVSRFLYWTDHIKQTITRSSFDGSNRTTFISVIPGHPRAIVVSAKLGYLFWTVVTPSQIERCRVDGTDRETIISTDFTEINALALDTYESKLYWIYTAYGSVFGKIERSEFDGSQRELIREFPQPFYSFGLVVLENAIIWTECYTRGLHVSDRDFKYNRTSLQFNVSTCLWGLTFFSSVNETDTDGCRSFPCQNGGTCSNQVNAYVCECVDQFYGINCEYNNADYVELEERLQSTIEVTKNITTEEVEEAAYVVVEATGNTEFFEDNPERVHLVISALESLVNVEDTSSDVTEPVVEIVNNLMNIDEDVLLEGTLQGGRVVAALENQVAYTQTNEGNFSRTFENIGVTAVKIDKRTLGNSLAFANVFTEEARPKIYGDLRNSSGQLFADGGDIPVDRITSSIAVPTTILDSAEKADIELAELPISFFIHGNAVLFTPSRSTYMSSEGDETDGNTTEVIASQVISAVIEVGNITVTNLTIGSQNVITKFVTNISLGVNEIQEAKECVYWSYDDKSGKGFWANEGCEMLEEELDRAVCSCNRLASFAILVRVRKGSYDIQISLYYITVVGSVISGVCLVLCIVTFLSLKTYRSRQPTYIHLNLCLSLLGFYLVFLLSLLAAQDRTLCSIASAAIHFFGLATLSWMSVEAVNMYYLFVKMEKAAIRYFIPVACFLAYGGSAVCALLAALLDSNTEFKSSDYCFLHPGLALYFGFLLEVAFLFVLNLIIFTMIVRKMLCRPMMVSKTQENARRNEIIVRVRHGILFWFALGLSWLFGFLSAVDQKTLIFDYLYCIFTAIQGVMMFLLLCVANPEFRKVFIRSTRNDTSYTSGGRTASSKFSSTKKLAVDSQSDIQMEEVKN